jgi:hypothetical protein
LYSSKLSTAGNKPIGTHKVKTVALGGLVKNQWKNARCTEGNEVILMAQRQHVQRKKQPVASGLRQTEASGHVVRLSSGGF